MNIVKAKNLACPIDGLHLETREKQLICENGHTYDVARQGYVNLLPVQHKRSKEPGDSKEMIVARTDFLNSGLYQPVARKLSELLFGHMRESGEVCILDAGCGEGYYLDFLFNACKDREHDGDFSFVGLDISKPAIIASAKRNRRLSWVVGTNRQPPVETSSVDIVICVFGFQSFEGFKKILKPDGKVILVEPGTDHLKELRDIIYSDVKKSKLDDDSISEENGFVHLDKQQLQFKTESLTNQQINQLLLMTPHLFRATKEGKEEASRLQSLEVTVDMVFSVYAQKGT